MRENLYFRQLLAGRDFGRGDEFATGMANFIYLIGDTATRECVIVDPAWDIPALLDVVDADGMTLVGALGTHYHPDHIGGSMMGFSVPQGVPELIAERPVKLHVNEVEAEWVRRVTGLETSDLELHASGDALDVGDVRIKFIHTPGHSPGSQCFLVDDRMLVSGDTLFVQGCGRVDLPGSDSSQMYESLTQKLAKLPDDTILYPGHNYGGGESTIGDEKRSNVYMRISSLADWTRLMG